MKTLLLLRHAKSSWKDQSLDDHDRPLNQRGRLAAPLMGNHIKTLGLVPTQILSSTAVRARETAEAIAKATGYGGTIDAYPELYLASAGELIKTAAKHARTTADILLIVAHNPGMERLNSLLSGLNEPFPTAALGGYAIDISQWSELTLGTPIERLGLWRPKELE